MFVALATAPSALATTSNPTPLAGQRRGATRLPFSISGTAYLSVDVGTGNGLFTDQLLTLPGIGNDVPVTLSYNSSVWGTSTPSAVTGDTGSGWVISGFDERMVTNADGSVTFYGPAGLSGVFTPSGSTFTSPPQFQATLTGTQSSGYTLTDHLSQEKLNFNSNGRLTTDTDRNGNATTYAYDSNGWPASITSTRGTTAGRTVTFTVSGGKITKLTQTSGSLTRNVQLRYSSMGHLSAVIDTAGGSTQFASPNGTDTGQVAQIINPKGAATNLSFTSGKVSAVAQDNPPIDGGAGTSTTRLTYPSSTQTLVADPTTDQGQAVSAVPHTTYTIDTANLVSSSTDPDGNTRSDTYTSLGQVKTDTPAAGGATTFGYTANGGESLNSVATPGGATSSAGYTNTGGSAYLPTSTTDSSGNATTYTYDGAGNPATTAQGTGAQAKVTRNSYGQVITSQIPAAGTGVQTTYTYDSTTHDLTNLTPPTGDSLGQRNYTWDGFGRLSTATDGRGNTITYAYDNADRITKVDYSDTGTPDVTYSYDSLGHVLTRVDGSGTTTYSYDDLGQLLSTTNTANNNTVTYTYDLAGDLASVTDGLGTDNYGYDPAHQLQSITYPQSGSTQTTWFANNADGQRTDVWLQTDGADHSTWAAHEHFSYDNSGRVITVKGENGPATSPTTVENETLCYATGVSPQSCTSPPASSDRANIQSTYESVSGETNTYTYDDHNRLTKDVVTGGTNPRTYTYTYGAASNRTGASVTGSSPTSQTLAYNPANQIKTTGYTYDGAGNLTTSPTRTATYNTAGQQTSATVSGTTSTYTYAGTNSDELLTETIPGDRTYSLTYGRPDSNGLPEVDSVNAGGVGTGYVISDNTGTPIMLATSSGNTCLYLYDGIHNPIGLSTSFQTTAQAFRYDPYGGTTTTNNSGYTSAYENPYTFGEGITDRATGEIKFGQRFYNPTTGSWTQQDALNAPLDPTNANRYQYAADNPVNNADSSGSSTCQVPLGISDIIGSTVDCLSKEGSFALRAFDDTIACPAAGIAPFSVASNSGIISGFEIGGDAGGIIGAVVGSAVGLLAGRDIQKLIPACR